jgi:hypothetical protein
VQRVRRAVDEGGAKEPKVMACHKHCGAVSVGALHLPQVLFGFSFSLFFCYSSPLLMATPD